LILVIPAPVAAFIYPPIPEGAIYSPQEQIALGMALVVAFLVGVTILAPWTVCKTVADGFRMERERSTLGFLLMTPLSSRGVALGHCAGALLPSFALWLGTALFALIPTSLLAGIYQPFPAFWGWAYGFFLSLMYLVMCAVVGMWIGITEIKARDMTIGVYLLPMSFCVIAAGCAFYAYRYWRWSYFQYNALFVAICLALIVWIFSNAMKELHRMRRGDVPFEGRSVSN
jgi:ABC-type Na+ efflux pump permease subunit